MPKREFNEVNIKVEFNETANRQQISSGDSLNTLFGKIKKWFSDLKTVAFTGKYDDLSNKPTIPTVPTALKNPNALTFTGAVTGNYDGSAAKSVAIPSSTNNLMATVEGTWLDATQGKVLDDKIYKISTNLGLFGTISVSHDITMSGNELKILNLEYPSDVPNKTKIAGAFVSINSNFIQATIRNVAASAANVTLKNQSTNNASGTVYLSVFYMPNF